MSRTAKQILKDIIADVDAMRSEPPADIRLEGDQDTQVHWFGGFEQGHVDHEAYTGTYIQWPNLGLLIQQATAVIGKHDAVRAAMIAAKKAMEGDSNDAEHDALVDLLEALEEAGV